MISVKEARQLIKSSTRRMAPVTRNLLDAAQLVIADNIVSLVNFPPFPQSAMDGYAFSFDEYSKHPVLKILGEIPAGHFYEGKIPGASAMRIYTGAAVPPGYDTVVIQEKVKVSGNQLHIEDEQMKAGANVRAAASQTRAGDKVVSGGIVLSPAVTGLLAGLGIHQLSVFPPPRVSLVSTGDELVTPGLPLPPGKIYESNSYTLNTALLQLNIKPIHISWCGDNEKKLTQLLENLLTKSDVLILSGGVSVGEYDFVSKALKHCGVSALFHKVKQKPGKPLLFGKKNSTLVFGLPGNPAAVLTCFYEYIAPTLRYMMGQPGDENDLLSLPLSAPYTKKTGLFHFLKGKITNGQVVPLQAQESYLMNSFAEANCIIHLPEEITEFKAGDKVNVRLLDFK